MCGKGRIGDWNAFPGLRQPKSGLLEEMSRKEAALIQAHGLKI